MRQSICKVVSCCDVPLPIGHKYVAIQLLTGDTLNFIVDTKSSGQELFDLACESMKLSDAKLFGLAVLIDGEYQFLDLRLKLSKHMPKIWKCTNENGLNEVGVQALVFYFRVQFYVDCHYLLRERTARHHYYLQLRENVISYSQALSVEKAFLLAALALQADLGNYNSQKQYSSYFDPKKYFPLKIISRVGLGYIEQHTPSLHKDYFGLNKGEAQALYVKESSEQAAPHNFHLYRINKRKTKDSAVLWLGISFTGIQFFEESKQFTKRRISLFHWSDISRLHFDKKKFGIRFNRSPEPWTLTYYTSSDDLSKSLLWLCRATHQFCMFIEPQVKEIQRRVSSSHKQYRESYIYSNSLDLAWEKRQRNSLMHISPLKKEGSNGSDNCVSVISNTSSNTTSGIVSDKNHSHDESEDDNGMDIITDVTPIPVTRVGSLQKNQCHKPCCGSLKDDLGTTYATNRNHVDYKSKELQEFENLAILKRDDKVIFKSDECLGTIFQKKYDFFKCSCNCYQQVNACSQLSANKPFVVANQETCKHPCECEAIFCKSVKDKTLQEAASCMTNCSFEDCCKCSCKSMKHVKYHQKESVGCNSTIPVKMNNSLHQKAFIHHHIRNTTKIGVSSLTRLRGFQGSHLEDCAIVSASSEPSLNDSASCYCASHKKEFPLELSSLPIIPGIGENKDRSHNLGSMLSNVFPSSATASELEISTNISETRNFPIMSWYSKERLAVFPSLASNFLGYHNSSNQVNDVHRLGSLPVLPISAGDQHSNIFIDSFSNSLDLHQLRQKSSNVDFSLISFCNDRPLLMLPKTVPTCSRQRHIGKDFRRFSCSALLSDMNEKNFDSMNGFSIKRHYCTGNMPETASTSSIDLITDVDCCNMCNSTMN